MDPQEDGLSLEDHLKSHWRQTGVMPVELEFVPVSFEVAHLWDIWIELDRMRDVVMDVCHIKASEMEAWLRLLKMDLTPFEVRGIMAIESEYMKMRRARAEKDKPSS